MKGVRGWAWFSSSLVTAFALSLSLSLSVSLSLCLSVCVCVCVCVCARAHAHLGASEPVASYLAPVLQATVEFALVCL